MWGGDKERDRGVGSEGEGGRTGRGPGVGSAFSDGTELVQLEGTERGRNSGSVQRDGTERTDGGRGEKERGDQSSTAGKGTEKGSE